VLFSSVSTIYSRNVVGGMLSLPQDMGKDSGAE